VGVIEAKRIEAGVKLTVVEEQSGVVKISSVKKCKEFDNHILQLRCESVVYI